MNKWSKEIQFPTNSNYICRVVEESFGPSKGSGNPMITLKTEIVSPNDVNIGGSDYVIAGIQPAVMYYVTQKLENGEVDVDGTKNAFERVFKSTSPDKKSLYDLFELPQPEDFENPTLGFKGKTFFCVIEGRKTERRMQATPEQLEAANKKGIHASQAGDVMKNPMTGKPLVHYYPTITEIFGLAPVDGSKPY